MAGDAYWTQQSSKIKGPFTPMSREVLIGNGPLFAVTDAITLGVVERHDEARRLLESFVPSLLAVLSDEDEFNCFPEHEKLGRLANLRTQAHVAHWLLNGEFDSRLSKLASDAQWRCFRLQSSSVKPDVVLLLQLMLFEIESGSYGKARELYEQHEKSPLKVPPESLRFSRNPRSLIYTHLRSTEIGEQILREARASFRAAATKWEKDVSPILHVLLPEAARIFSACLRLTGQAHAPLNVFPLLR
jgi:hypothetical protein